MDGISTVSGSTQGSLFGDGYVTILLQGYDTEQVLQVLLNQYGYAVSELKYCSGVMGVPITFLDKYCPEQFEIIGGTANGQVPDEMKIGNYSVYNNPFIGVKKIYQRILIRPKREGAN